jgi:hypothetical protein
MPTPTRARARPTPVPSLPTHRAVVRRRGAGGPPGGGGRLPDVRSTLGLAVESRFGPQKVGLRRPIHGVGIGRTLCSSAADLRRGSGWASEQRTNMLGPAEVAVTGPLG